MTQPDQTTSSAALDLSSVPPIYILPAHVPIDDLHQYEDQVYAAQGTLTYSPKEARIFLGKISQKKRASFELRSNGVWTEDAPAPATIQPKARVQAKDGRSRKRRRLNEDESSPETSYDEELKTSPDVQWPDLDSHILVLKLDWLDLCLKHNSVLSYLPHLVYSGKIIPNPPNETSPPSKSKGTVTYIKANPDSTPGSSRLPSASTSSVISHTPRRFNSTSPRLTKHPPPKLHRTTTSEHEALTRPNSPSTLPPLPAWATGPHATYSCRRSTPLHPTNASFITQLTAIKLSRILTLDEIGVRAYSTSIASIAAYPHALSSEAEVLRLPGCNARIAELWREWIDSAPPTSADSERYIQHVRDLESDADLKCLKLFYNIWGVGADTARKLYFEHGFKDLDDLVEYHWQSLSRVQQIGVKFYDEFLKPIPRHEVEGISATILRNARTVASIPTDAYGGEEDVICVIVGGYRRGKAESGDVDVILSHRDEHVTKDLVVDVVRSLEAEGWVTHTLTLQTTTSDRNQQTLPYKGKGHGHGFDSLDKALCVWQDPNFDASQTEGGAKNPNVHRRVDIILSPWRTVGCAILGWSGGTTFQRDIRRFASKQRGWKFDSSGVRDRGSGMVIDLERPKEGEGDRWQERERRVMEGLGIGFREAGERCTG